MPPRGPRAAKHLSAESAIFWRQVTAAYELEPHHLLLLKLACEALDRCNAARRALAEKGLTQSDRFGFERPRGEIVIERDSRLAFARLIKAAGLDAAEIVGLRIEELGKPGPKRRT